MSKPRGARRPSSVPQWTLQVTIGGYQFETPLMSESEAKGAYTLQIAKLVAQANGAIRLLELRKDGERVASQAPNSTVPRQSPAPQAPGPDGVRRFAPVGREIKQFRAYDTAEALGL